MQDASLFWLRDVIIEKHFNYVHHLKYSLNLPGNLEIPQSYPYSINFVLEILRPKLRRYVYARNIIRNIIHCSVTSQCLKEIASEDSRDRLYIFII